MAGERSDISGPLKLERPSISVLHVVESWGAGVASAVADYVSTTPHLTHWLLAAPRAGEDNLLQLGPALKEKRTMPAGHAARFRALASAYRDIRPDVVHAHSSYAGLYVRACAAIPAKRIVYSPHCYGFERTDVSPLARLAIKAAESVLARRTAAVAAVSQREASLAARLQRRQRVYYVPNIIPVSSLPERALRQRATVTTIGRISAQKDPEFFVRASQATSGRTRWVWIGDGSQAARERLEDAGVEVTGWLSRDEVRDRLRQADIYVHTALWESAPLAILEAVGQGLPVVAREIPPLTSLGLPCLTDTPEAMADAVEALAVPGAPGLERRRANFEETKNSLRENVAPVQAQRLLAVYGLVSGKGDSLCQHGSESQ